jgi:hypothetical protein
MSPKEAALSAIHRLPDDVDYQDIADEIACLMALREGEKAADEGKVRSSESVKGLLAAWTAK